MKSYLFAKRYGISSIRSYFRTLYQNGNKKTVMSRARRFSFGFLAIFSIGILYPVSILWKMGFGGIIWIKNDPAFSCFVLFLLPLAAGIFFTIFDRRKITSLKRFLRAFSLIALIMFEVATIGFVLDDAVNTGTSIVPPFLLSDFGEAVVLDLKIRQQVPRPRQLMFQPKYLAVDWTENYTQNVQPFQSIRDRLTRGSSTASIAVVINLVSGIFVVFAFWYIVIMMIWIRPSDRLLVNTNTIHPPRISDDEVEAIALIIAITLLWFPMRLYSDWYQDFYSLKKYSSYFMFWELMALVLFAIIGLIIMKIPDKLVKILTSLSALLTLILVILGEFKPEVLWFFWGVVESASLWGYVVFVWLLFFFFCGVVLSRIDLYAPR
ncbi:MAG: hypothetical protein U9Q05_06630 [Thermodesulfobacteriota bacterium]|nr:hypothetical protein [Thermodesulfobacteriota bacterium]